VHAAIIIKTKELNRWRKNSRVTKALKLPRV
jgi:hypothetical protein